MRKYLLQLLFCVLAGPSFSQASINWKAIQDIPGKGDKHYGFIAEIKEHYFFMRISYGIRLKETFYLDAVNSNSGMTDYSIELGTDFNFKGWDGQINTIFQVKDSLFVLKTHLDKTENIFSSGVTPIDLHNKTILPERNLERFILTETDIIEQYSLLPSGNDNELATYFKTNNFQDKRYFSNVSWFGTNFIKTEQRFFDGTEFKSCAESYVAKNGDVYLVLSNGDYLKRFKLNKYPELVLFARNSEQVNRAAFQSPLVAEQIYQDFCFSKTEEGTVTCSGLFNYTKNVQVKLVLTNTKGAACRYKPVYSEEKSIPFGITNMFIDEQKCLVSKTTTTLIDTNNLDNLAALDRCIVHSPAIYKGMRLYVRGDGSKLISAEEMFTVGYTATGTLGSIPIRKAISLFSIDAADKLEWVRLIPKDQSYADLDYLSFISFFDGESLNIAYNEHPTNIAGYDEYGPKTMTDPHEATLTHKIITRTGKIDTQKILSNQKKQLSLKPGLSFMNSKGQTIVYGSTGNYFAIGILH